MVDLPTADPSQEAFSPAVKACRDILVDEVDRHLGVPIIGTPTSAGAVTLDDINLARSALAAAIARLARDPAAARHGPYVSAARELLDQVAHLLENIALRGAADAQRIRHARRQLAAAIDHLTAVMFAQPDEEPGGDGSEERP